MLREVPRASQQALDLLSVLGNSYLGCLVSEASGEIIKSKTKLRAWRDNSGGKVLLDKH